MTKDGVEIEFYENRLIKRRNVDNENNFIEEDFLNPDVVDEGIGRKCVTWENISTPFMGTQARLEKITFYKSVLMVLAKYND